MKITQFDRKTCQMLGSAVEEALQQVSKNFGISINCKGGTFSSTNFTMKIEAAVIGQNGDILSKEVENFKMYCGMYNLLPDDLGKSFKANDGNTYQIKGLTNRGGKFPILAVNLTNGKTYKLPERMVQRGLGRKVRPMNDLP